MSSVRYAFDSIPEAGEAMPVAPGVFWIRLPLQLTGLSHINVWLLADGDGWTIVDTGMASDAIQDCWRQVFARHLDGKPVRRVICTHFHPDHMGQAGWLCQTWDAAFWTTRREWLFARMLYLENDDMGADAFREHFRRIGYRGQALEMIGQRGFSRYRNNVTPIPPQFRRIEDGDRVSIDGRDWRVVVGYGHAPEHACLVCDELGVMISGDQVLPKISPHIGVYPSEPDGNPLQEYIDSLKAFRGLSDDLLVLPSHNEPFYGLQGRLADLVRHHEVRLALLEEAVGEPKRIFSLLKVMFSRMLKPTETFLGVGETLAHLNCLLEQGRVLRELDGDGIYVYRRAGEGIDAA